MTSLLAPKQEPFVISVGGPDADLSGHDSLTIQKAIDLAKFRGGGIIKLGAGVFDVYGPIRLYDNITLIGVGPETVLRKTNGFSTKFVEDADYGELKAVVSDGSGIREGMGIQLFDSDHSDGWDVSTAVVTAVDGNVIHFDEYLVQDYLAHLNGTVSNACSLIEGVKVSNVLVANLVIDGNKENNDYMNGCRGGGIYFHKSARCTVEDVQVRNFNGDGISWQITENVSILNCEVFGCTNFGLHPGTGSFWTVVDGCLCRDNGSDGMYICWRVQDGVFRNNVFHNNGANGINIGHKDVNNLFENNRIYENANCGIHVRKEKESNGAHGNKFLRNIIENNGSAEGGYGVLVNGVTKEITFESNTIRDTGKGLQRTGIRLLGNVTGVQLTDNYFSGHVAGDVVEEQTQPTT